MREITYAQAVNEALRQSMEKDDAVFVIGEGVPDPKAIFGTTAGLREKFGVDRVLDMPLSENGLTGVCIGAALCGMRPVMVHQRIDFMLLAFDQLVNNAAKWSYMFNGQAKVPLVVRTLIGRGWGQGAQHSQSLQSLFGHIPGLKVVMPVTARDAKGMLIAAIEDDNPVIFIEHRWLHNIKDHTPEEMYAIPLDKARVMREGSDVTVASFSYMTLEALRAADALAERGISMEVVDMRSVRPLDTETVIESVRKTGRLIVADTAILTCGITAEVVARVTESVFGDLRKAPVRIGSPDHPAPTSFHLADHYYPDASVIASAAVSLMDMTGEIDINAIPALAGRKPLDVPDPNFKGPF